MAGQLRRNEPATASIGRIAIKQLGKARDLLAAQSLDDDAVHDIRRRLKRVRAALRLIQSALIKGLIDEARSLGDLLGDDHDLAVLMEMLEDHAEQIPDRDEAEKLAQAAQRRRRQLQVEARELGQRLFAERPKQFAARLK